ncbi:DUF6446 family protein [Roseovarius sp.]|uniref:DUF6446 family protein n=1 Tax=Roseovarius sp. TaxID=1486281 RepID=UPI002634EB15|nr:DUF6446 family protein [Roseovarius sp.]MDM8166387.1 DUF6446 family protein [Roseovarius sp.]
MTGKILSLMIVVCAAVAGVALYYLQVYAYYEEVEATGEDVRMTAVASGEPEVIAYDGFEGIDADSSPIRYRACFTTETPLAELNETYQPYERAVPLEAPGWFECFDAGALGAKLEDGSAVAFMGEENIEYGIDRIVAVAENGQGWVWHQINHCGEVVFDGQPAPEGCPEPPDRY